MSDRNLSSKLASDRRVFGRRAIVRHAWITANQRPRLPCCIRNLSRGGALLELDVPSWLPYTFELAFEQPKIVIACEVAHRGKHGVGVAFHANPSQIAVLEGILSECATESSAAFARAAGPNAMLPNAMLRIPA